ncbi:GPH family glycoside/pentoside/hexuronide:cation symporter [Klebsiella oxytoca]|uniref:GPH family glycoside/pentoside/hexuronide:cation symporter n=1 Tax=Klebsiella oxytoca TaxID=571 RepID=A0A318G499_KLEOX|nr:glycoside-pentoside-hexuronide (GPH):cation symporter [Klebsiella oxytoca]PXW46553.1 GPH family glycoside/pentoside/hexuronide:cation symporter [Klebsiella oxytoca]HCB1500208.1 MFS transporter [Klebsiella michiganensis]HCB1846262.1 MFS transporter [Klebsiella oxytoca]
MTTKVTRKEKISYGLGDMASHIGLDNVIIFLTFYYTDVVGLPAAFVGTMFLLARTADAIIDPAMGYMADRTRSRWGKFRPWMLWLALPFGLSCLLTYAVPQSLDMAGKMIFASVSYTFMMLMYTAINIPYCSMGAVITPDNDERISLQSWRFFLATLGGAMSTFFMMPLAEYLGGADKLAGYRWAMAIMASAAVIMFWICFANTRERIKAPATHNNYLSELRDLLRNDQWRVVAVLVMTNIGFGVIRLGAMMYFVTYYLGSASYFMWMLGAHILGKAAGSLLAKRLTRNFNKVQMFGYCAVLAGVLSIALFFAPKSVFVLVPLTFIISTLYQATTTLMWVMMADVADYGEWRQGKRMDGVIFSTFLAVLKLGMALSGAIVGWTLGFSGYVANAPEQTSLAMNCIVALFTVIPGLLSLAAFATLRWYKLDDQAMQEINLAKTQSLVKG